MKGYKYIFIFLIVVQIIFLSCRKKIFKHIEFHGRVVSFMTNQPKEAFLELHAQVESSQTEEGRMTLGSKYSNSDGTFHIKTQACRHPIYYFLLVAGGANTSGGNSVDLKLTENKDIDLGDIPIGKYTFLCKVHVVPSSGFPIDFPNLGPSGSTLHFNSGTDTTFITSQTFDPSTYEMLHHNFRVGFKVYPGGLTKDSAVYISINSPDTLHTTINY